MELDENEINAIGIYIFFRFNGNCSFLLLPLRRHPVPGLSHSSFRIRSSETSSLLLLPLLPATCGLRPQAQIRYEWLWLILFSRFTFLFINRKGIFSSSKMSEFFSFSNTVNDSAVPSAVQSKVSFHHPNYYLT